MINGTLQYDPPDSDGLVRFRDIDLNQEQRARDQRLLYFDGEGIAYMNRSVNTRRSMFDLVPDHHQELCGVCMEAGGADHR